VKQFVPSSRQSRPARGVSFGILALSGLLGAAARYGKTSEFRSTATLLAADIADRMRANMPALNPLAVPVGSITAYDVTDPWEADMAEPPAAECANPCTAAQMAAMDVAEWRRALYFSLPNGTGYLAYDPGSRSADVWIAWLDPAASSDEAKFGSDDQHQECPPGFRELTPQPRCMFFRVGL